KNKENMMKKSIVSDIIKKNLKVHIIISTFVKISILVIFVSSIYRFNLLVAFAALAMLIASFLPSIIARRYKVFLPPEFEIMFSVFLYASFMLGEMRDYYLRYWWWDQMLHGFSALMLGLAGFLIIYSFYQANKIKSSPIIAALFSFTFALSLGALWEIIEFTIDYFLHTNMQKSGLVDTMTDLMTDAVGALIASGLGYAYLRSGRVWIVDHLIDRFVNKNWERFRLKNKTKE
ncbi:MAG: hypothetical protein NT001_04995, partial [Candidatus Woesearchaeota archaeon]|nr:hypothetical protein [Candidatus Woesearchaeota archaeon]